MLLVALFLIIYVTAFPDIGPICTMIAILLPYQLVFLSGSIEIKLEHAITLN